MIKTNFIEIYEELSTLNEVTEKEMNKPKHQSEINEFLTIEEFKQMLPLELTNYYEYFMEYFDFLKNCFEANGNSRCIIPYTSGSNRESHHIIFLSFGGKDTIKNSIGLTKDNHKEAHVKFSLCLFKLYAVLIKENISKDEAIETFIYKCLSMPRYKTAIIQANETEKVLEEFTLNKFLQEIKKSRLAKYRIEFKDGEIIETHGIAGTVESLNTILKSYKNSITPYMISDWLRHKSHTHNNYGIESIVRIKN